MRRRCGYCGHDHDYWLADLFCGAGGAAMGWALAITAYAACVAHDALAGGDW